MKADALSGDFFPFTNRRRTRAGVLRWDGTGLCLYQKRLERGRFAPLWRRSDEAMLERTLSELALFLEENTLLRVIRLSPSPTPLGAFSLLLPEAEPC
jgi:transposase